MLNAVSADDPTVIVVVGELEEVREKSNDFRCSSVVGACPSVESNRPKLGMLGDVEMGIGRL